MSASSQWALAISASSRGYSVALRNGVQTFASDPDSGRGAADLAAVVAELLQRHSVAADDLEELIVDVGPGSYTGLRVAVTFARVLVEFGSAKLHSTTSLELMALAAWSAGAAAADATLRPVLDARRQRFHHASVRLSPSNDGLVELLDAPQATTVAEFHAASQPDEILVASSDVIAALAYDAAPPHIEPHPFDATLMFDPRLAPRVTSIEELEPLYLMGTYADS